MTETILFHSDPGLRAGEVLDECTYPGPGRLFADADLPGYDRVSSEDMWRRVLTFLDRIEETTGP